MKVSLSVLERILLINLLPAESDILTLKVVRKTKDLVGFTEDELKVLEFRNEEKNGQVITKWKFDAVEKKSFDIDSKVVEMIADGLKKLNEQKKITENHLSLYEKIVENGQD